MGGKALADAYLLLEVNRRLLKLPDVGQNSAGIDNLTRLAQTNGHVCLHNTRGAPSGTLLDYRATQVQT